MFFVILIITLICLFLALKKKRPLLLVVPFATIFVYFAIQVLSVPAPLFDTLKFIFGLGS